MRACARVALVLMALSASFGLAGCAAIDELREAFLRWVESEKLPSERGLSAGDVPDAAPVIPPEKPQKKVASKPSKRIKTARKPQRPETVVLPPEKPPIPDSTEAARPESTEGQSAPSPPAPQQLPSRWPATPPSERFSRCGCASQANSRPHHRNRESDSAGAVSVFGHCDWTSPTGASAGASTALGSGLGASGGTISAAKITSGSRLAAANSPRSCFASSRQCSLSARSSRSDSWASDNARRSPSTSALNAAVSGLFANAGARINRRMSAMLNGSRCWWQVPTASSGMVDESLLKEERPSPPSQRRLAARCARVRSAA